MELNTHDILIKKLLDTQEQVRDFEVYSQKIEDKNLSKLFQDFSEECAMQAAKLNDIITNSQKQK